MSNEATTDKSKTKPHRNGPCPCGSGRKYKKCCMPKDQEIEKKVGQPALKNEFRDEVQRPQRTDAEQLHSRQQALLIQLELQATMHGHDEGYLTESCRRLRQTVVGFKALPDFDGKDGLIDNVEKQIVGIQEAIKRSAPSWQQRVYRETLRQVLRDQGASEPASSGVDEGIIEVSPAGFIPDVAKKVLAQKPAGPKMGPIKTDEDEDEDDDD